MSGTSKPTSVPYTLPCAKCRIRDGSIYWGDALAVSHGFAQMVCEVCALTEQLAHARERSSVIPVLEERLRELGVANP